MAGGVGGGNREVSPYPDYEYKTNHFFEMVRHIMKKLLFINILLTFLLIIWGGVVRNFDAGLACPDWPLCHGKIIPPLDPLVWIEWGHRLLASVVGLMTLVISFSYRKKFGFIAFLPLLLVIFQALLGGATVKGVLHPKWVSLHLAFGLLYFASLLWILLRAESQVHFGRKWSPPSQITAWLFCLFATLLVYGQAVLGGGVASSGAGLACPDFPTCYGAWLPELKGGVALQFFHRVGAFLVILVSVLLFGFSYLLKGANGGYDFRKMSSLILVLTFIQVGLGISNVIFRLPEFLSIFHLVFATLLFASFFILTYKVQHARVS
jgi:cytochrome c oxidase assembly protein subunit 15